MHESEHDMTSDQQCNVILIPPGGLIAFSCATFPSTSDQEPPGGDIMRQEPLNSLEAFMIQPVAADYYQSLPLDARKQLEGLEGYALAAAIEELYEKFILDQFSTSIPAADRKKLAKLPETDRYSQLRTMKSKLDQQAYSTERLQARKTAEYVQKNMVPEQQSLFAPYPHSLARRSVFHIEENENMKRDHLAEFVIGAGPWGLIVYSGTKLFTADEKAWVVLLALAAEQKRKGVVDWHVVRGSIRSFLRDAGLSESGQYSDRFVESITAMHGGVFRFEGKECRVGGANPKKRPFKELIEGYHLISNYSIDNMNGDFIVILDRSFIETFVTEFHMYARLDIKRFCKQRPTASALHRFFVGHTPDPDGCIRMNLFLVAKSTNMLTEFPQDINEWPNPDVKYAKKRITLRALTRLIEDGTFGPRTGIKVRGRGEDDLVVIDFNTVEKLNKPTPKKRLPPATV